LQLFKINVKEACGKYSISNPSKNLKNIFITEKHMKYEKDTGCIEARVFPKCLVIKFSPVGILKCGETLC